MDNNEDDKQTATEEKLLEMAKNNLSDEKIMELIIDLTILLAVK